MSEKVKEMIGKLKQDKSISKIKERQRYAEIEYSSNQNINHTFRSRVFPNDSVKQRLLGGGTSYDTTNIGYDTQIDTSSNQKIITYRASDIGTTNNVNRVEKPKETLGYPFRRHISYQMMADGKDRLQYRANCIETHIKHKDGNRYKPLDNHFVTKVFYLYTRFALDIPSYQVRDLAKKQKTISGNDVLEMLHYLYSAIKSYHPFFYHNNGVCKYNVEWLYHTILEVERLGLLDYQYRLTKVNRDINTNSRNITAERVKQWRIDRQRKIDSGEYIDVL